MIAVAAAMARRILALEEAMGMREKRRRRVVYILAPERPFIPTDAFFRERRAELLAQGTHDESDVFLPFPGFASSGEGDGAAPTPPAESLISAGAALRNGPCKHDRALGEEGSAFRAQTV